MRWRLPLDRPVPVFRSSTSQPDRPSPEGLLTASRQPWRCVDPPGRRRNSNGARRSVRPASARPPDAGYSPDRNTRCASAPIPGGFSIMKTRAAVLREIGQPWSVEEIELDPPKRGEVLVKLAASGMCHSDEHAYDGHIAGLVPPPMMIGGHEGAGVVQEVGEGVDWLEPGDHVVFGFIPACGRCPSCADGHSNLCDLLATFAEGTQALDGTLPAPHARRSRPRPDVPARYLRRAHRRQRGELHQDRQGLAARQGLPARLWRRDRLGLGGVHRRSRPGRLRGRRRLWRHRLERHPGRQDGRRPGGRRDRPRRVQAREGDGVRRHAHVRVDRGSAGGDPRGHLGPRLRPGDHDHGNR